MSQGGAVDEDSADSSSWPVLPPGTEPFRHALTDTPLNWRRVVTWSLYDWGTQPYHSVIITFVFAVYITGSSFGDVNHTTSALTMMPAMLMPSTRTRVVCSSFSRCSLDESSTK